MLLKTRFKTQGDILERQISVKNSKFSLFFTNLALFTILRYNIWPFSSESYHTVTYVCKTCWNIGKIISLWILKNSEKIQVINSWVFRPGRTIIVNYIGEKIWKPDREAAHWSTSETWVSDRIHFSK